MPPFDFTVNKISRWRPVPDRLRETDFWAECTFCKQDNRVRLGSGLQQLELSACGHYAKHEFIKSEGIVRFTFGK